MGDFWVFGYGSLMWKPGFDYLEECHASVVGYHRSLCVYSWVHRGTQEQPGLVFGLDSGGSCDGVAFKVAGGRRDEVVAYLRERELVTNVYLERWADINLVHGEQVKSLVYVVDDKHPQYAGKLSLETQRDIVAGSRGKSGDNDEYVVKTVEQLVERGIHDADLVRLRDALMPSAQAE